MWWISVVCSVAFVFSVIAEFGAGFLSWISLFVGLGEVFLVMQFFACLFDVRRTCVWNFVEV
jgi:hypothetical protein